MRLSVRLLPFAVTVICVACRDVPQAPNVTPPPERPFQVFILDHEGQADDGPGFSTPVILALGAAGPPIQILYVDQYRSFFRYGSCVDRCGDSASWRLGTFSGGGGYQIAPYWGATFATSAGAVHTLYQGWSYNRPPPLSMTVASWHATVIDSGGAVGWDPALVARPDGHLYGIHADQPWAAAPADTATMDYVECATSCDSAASWQGGHLWRTPPVTGTALRIDVTGRLHLLYWVGPDPHYATCASACADSTQWTRTTLASGATQAYSDPRISWSVAAFDVTSDGHLGLAYWVGNTLRLLTCATSCGSAGAWLSTSLLTLPPKTGAPWGGGALALTADSTGGWHTAFAWGLGYVGMVTYAACDSACESPISWRATTVDSGYSGAPSVVALGVDPARRPHLFFGSFYFPFRYAEPSSAFAGKPVDAYFALMRP